MRATNDFLDDLHQQVKSIRGSMYKLGPTADWIHHISSSSRVDLRETSLANSVHSQLPPAISCSPAAAFLCSWCRGPAEARASLLPSTYACVCNQAKYFGAHQGPGENTYPSGG